MILQLTDYAVGVLATNPSPSLDVFKIGSAYNYVPVATDTDIHGTTLFTGAIAPPLILNANVVKYTIAMDTSIGNFDWGEVGFFYQGQLFALAVGNSLESKLKAGASSGNQVRLDAFLTVVGTNYNMIVDQADSANQFQMASLSTIDQLPPSNQASPNAYIISGASASQSSFIAYTDRTGLWNFDAFQYSRGAPAVITAADIQSVTIALSDYVAAMNPSYFGQVALEFTTGKLYSICRYVKTAIQSGSSVTLGFQTPLAVVPNVGDRIMAYTRMVNSAAPDLPIATANVLGGIKIGTGLQVTADGTCSVDPASLGAVTSVNGKGPGAVTLVANDITGLATVAKTGLYSDLIGAPGPYNLPIASLSTLGGVKLPLTGNITINGQGVIDLGFAPVKTVNGASPDANGNVQVALSAIGLINPASVTSGADLNTYKTTGLFTVTAAVAATLTNAPATTQAATLEVVPLVNGGVGDSVQRWTTSTGLWWRACYSGTWGAWQQVATQAVATTTSLGVVKIGAGLAVAGDGTISTDYSNVPIATTTTLGAVKVGSGLSITAQGVLSWDTTQLPIATTTSLGVIKVGSGLAVAGDGTLSNAYSLPIATASILGGIKIGSGLSIDGTGVVSVTALSGKLDRVNGTAVGLFIQGNALPAATTTISASVATANFQTVTVTGTGTVTWSLSGWPSAGTYAEMEFQVTNGGLASSHSFPAAVLWVKPDGTTTTDFSAYMTAKRGATNFQAAGVDFVIFWSSDGGTTIYAKVL